MRQTRSQTRTRVIEDTNGNHTKTQEYAELKVILDSFNNLELLSLLDLPNTISYVKSALRQRALSLLEKSFSSTRIKIRTIYNNRKVSSHTPPSTQMYQDMNMVLSQQGNGTANHPNGTNNGVVVYNQQQGLPQPNVILKKLAFFEVMGTLIKPTLLQALPNQRIQETTYYFQLTAQQASEIAMNRDVRNQNKIEHVIQVQLRFCSLETTQTSCEQHDDFFPPNIVVKVNSKMCTLPNPIPTNKPNAEPKRPPRPVNLTPNVKITPITTNQVHISWCTDFSRSYFISVYLVKKLSSAQLLTSMKTGQKIQPDSTRSMIKEKLNEDADCEIATTMLKVSLVCPLGKMRMTTPCRASSCSHMQCFDAFTYLQMNEKKPTWNCPVCDKPAPYEKLVIDGYFQEVLTSRDLSSDTNEIQLHKDGSWSTHVVGSDSQSLDTPCKKYQSVEVISDDLEVITETKHPISHATSMASLNEATSTTTSTSVVPIEQSVDLTLTDSDEDVPVKNNQPPSKALVSTAAPINTAAASRTNDTSIITVDTPSPPASPVNNISSIYVDTPPSHMINTNSGVSSTTHNSWTVPALNSLANNHNLLPGSPLLQDPLAGAFNDFYQRQILHNNSPLMYPYTSADDENRYTKHDF